MNKEKGALKKVALWVAAILCFVSCVVYLMLAQRAGSTIQNMSVIAFSMLCGAAFFAYEAVHSGQKGEQK